MTLQYWIVLGVLVIELVLGLVFAHGELKRANKALRAAQEEYWMRRGARGINRGLLRERSDV